MNARVDKFFILLLDIEIKARDRIELPPYAGSTLRGALGVALKRVCCVARRVICGECLLRNSCVYVYLFETPLLGDGPEAARFRNAPHPFVLKVPTLFEPTVLSPGDTWSFGMALFGKAINWLPYMVAAIQRMGEIGIGRGRGTFDLSCVRSVGPDGMVWETVYVDEKLAFPERVIDLSELASTCAFQEGNGMFRIHFLTPLRLKYRGKLVNIPEFHIIVGNLLQRLNVLMKIHSDVVEPIPSQNYIALAREVELVENATAWHDWERYSHRQRRKTRLGGFVGTAVYRGDPTAFEPYLTLGSIIHVGKNTGFGLGNYRWEYM
ncbi:MAG: CRISPR system precrRNA processing endoribonuclease RAMP protein Cas6 [Thermodesulforhabdaceae bacterium]|jgi:hypothetical protein